MASQRWEILTQDGIVFTQAEDSAHALEKFQAKMPAHPPVHVWQAGKAPRDLSYEVYLLAVDAGYNQEQIDILDAYIWAATHIGVD